MKAHTIKINYFKIDLIIETGYLAYFLSLICDECL